MIYDLRDNNDLNKFWAKVNYFAESSKVVELTEKRKKRTLKQNDYYWALVSMAAIELGYTKKQMHDNLKIVFNEKTNGEITEIVLGRKQIKSTSTFDTKLMTRYINWILDYMPQEHGCYLPTPDDYKINRYKYDKEIQKYEQYL